MKHYISPPFSLEINDNIEATTCPIIKWVRRKKVVSQKHLAENMQFRYGIVLKYKKQFINYE
jgi:hypothetical protein